MIDITNLSKRYKVYLRPADRIKEWLSGGRKICHREFWALRNINLSIPPGVALGVIGQNGAGKSTLLRILTGVTKPTEGSFKMGDRVVSLLELGTGFHGEFTGRQNILMNGRLLGLSREEIVERLDEIVAFAELGEFIDLPMRTYSAGMQLRLGFALAASIDPQVLLIDEILSVGDAYFQQKCAKRMKAFKERGVTALIASHDLVAVKSLCDAVALFHEGRVIEVGKPDDVLDLYNALIAKQSSGSKPHMITRGVEQEGGGAGRRSGNFGAIISRVELLDERGESRGILVAGQKVTVAIRAMFFEAIEDPTVGMLIRDRLGLDVFGTNTFHFGHRLGAFVSGEVLEIEFTMVLDVGPGDYTITVAIHTLDVHVHECFDWVDRVLSFKVIPSGDFQFVGVAKLYPVVRWSKRPGELEESSFGEMFEDAPARLSMDERSEKFLLQGWYEGERNEAGAFRWSRQNCAFALRPKTNDLRVEVVMTRLDAGDRPLDGAVQILEKVIGRFSLKNSGPQVLSVRIPDAYVNQIIPIGISLDSFWRPCDTIPGSRDTRELGLAIREILAE
ncbi:ABC transporter ATP-binding protein [Patescibacteria group bacterium]|nr:MAG: ABC transporter ATP-binding protein [Patescibacteria group bacterium]